MSDLVAFRDHEAHQRNIPTMFELRDGLGKFTMLGEIVEDPLPVVRKTNDVACCSTHALTLRPNDVRQ